MMTGRLYIDGKDAFKQWGVFVVDGGWNDLLAFPPLKTIDSNDWQEDDGIEADLSDPQLNTKEASLKIAYTGLFSRFFEFMELLGDRSYHEFNCASIGRKFTLRLTQMPNLDAFKRLGFITLKLANDFPLKDYTYQAPDSNIMRSEDYLIDGTALTDYGCRVLQGSLGEIVKMAAVKQNLIRNIKTAAGAEYDDNRVTFKSKDVKLKILMRANTLAELWRNYDALLFDLIRPDERTLEVAELEQSFPFHYKNASVTNFYPDGKIWLEFTLTIVFTSDFRLNTDDFVLASEDGIIIFTQDEQNAIEMLPNRFFYPSLRLINDTTSLRLTGSGVLRFNN